MAQVSAALAVALQRVDGIDQDGLVGPIGSAVAQAKEALDQASGAAASAAEVLRILPAMLGADGPRTYAMLFLNPAEIRGGGGFFGGYAIIRADHGKLTLEKVESDKLLTRVPLDVSTMPADYRALWGASAGEWQSVNISPNFPYAAPLARAGLAARGTKVDGVVAIDTKVVAALLAGTGPVTAARFTITSANADAFFTKDIYRHFPRDSRAKDAAALELLRTVFGHVISGTLDAKALVEGAAPLVGERRLLVWSADPKEEAVLVGFPVGGLVPDAPGPFTTVALVNAAGNKLDAYLSASVDYAAHRCETDPKPSQLTLTLTNRAAANLPNYASKNLATPNAPWGSTLDLAYVYGPTGSDLVSATLDGAAVPIVVGTERGHPVWRFSVPLLRGQTRTLRVRFTEPHGDPSVPAVVMPQPLAIEEKTTASSAPCPA
jgi:hypothetical protein